MKKRLLSLLLVVVMMLGMFPVSVMATEEETVYISVSRDGRYIDDRNNAPMAYVPVTLPELKSVDLETYGLSEYQYDADNDGTYELTALHLTIYAYEEMYGGNWSGEVIVSGDAGSLYFQNGLFGADENLKYYVNGAYPLASAGWGATADRIVIEGGDFLDIASFTSWSFDTDAYAGFHYFMDGGSITHAYTAVAGEALTVSLGRTAQSQEYGTVINPVDPSTYYDADYRALPVYYATELYTENPSTAEIDKNGQAAITFNDAGTYYLWADGGYGAESDWMTGLPAAVNSPAYAVVTVTAPACAHETWKDATCSAPKTCAACGATDGDVDPDAHSFVDGACEYCGKSEIEPTPIVNADGNSIEWPYRGCNINKVIVNNVKVDGFTQNGSNYYITLNSAVADDAAVELGIGTFFGYNTSLWVLVDDQCITESPVSATTELPYTVQLENGTATVKIGGCPGYNTGSYIQQYAVNKTFYFSTSGQFPIAPMLNGGSTTSALRVENDTWSADLSAVFKNISDKEVTYKVAIDGAEAVECDADYTYTCDAPGTRKLVFTAVNDYGTSPSYTATINVLPSESIQEVDYEVQGGTITWFAFTDDQLNALPEGTTYEWDAETTTWTIIQPADINVIGKVITYYNLVKDDPTAKLPLLSGSNAVAGAGTMWDEAVRNQQTNTLSNGAVSTYVYLFEKTPTSTSEDQYTLIRFNYDRQKPETYFEYSVTGNAELTIVGDVGGVNGHQWTGDREVHVALNSATPTNAVISCVEKSNSVTLSDGAGQFSYKTGNWWEEKTWYVKYKIDQFPALVDNETTAVDVTIPALETYTLDLSTIFTDPDEGDTLSYQVKLNDGSWTNIEGSEYSYTPESAQEYVLTFRAYDGFVYAEDTYTVNMIATNATETYAVTVTAPENVQFYCTAEFAEGVDVLGTPIDANYAEGTYCLSVPANASRISWRKGEIGMSAAVEADSALTLIEANFKIMAGEAEASGALTVKYGEYTAVGSENSYLLLGGTAYTYEVTPEDTLYRAYNESDNTPVAGENVIELTLKHITVIAPAGSTVSSGRFYSYFRYDFNEAQKTTTLDDGRISVDFPVPGSEAFIRVQHPEGVTYWDFGGLSDGTTVEVTEAMLFVGSQEFTKETVYHNYEKNSHDTADLYLTVNAQGWLDMNSGDTHSLNVFRNWIPVANSVSNNGVSLPDVTYTVVDVNGNASDVIEVVPDASNSCYADIKAVKAGTAIILVSYDAVYNADGEGGKQFSAIWPENTGVIVVTVDVEDADIQTNITVNEEANAGGKQILDVEHDILFYVGDSGAEYSFKPEDGCTVTVARSTVDDEMTFNGFTAEGVTVAEDDTVTISGLTTGTHIIKVEKDGKTAYQGIRAREVEYKLTHSDGSEVTAENPAQPGETVTIQFSRLIAPLGKLSGVYNANFGFYYNGEDGAQLRIASGYAYGDYYFGSNAVRQRFTVTIPAEWNGASYTLTDGGIKLGGFGGSFGAHRVKSYREGAQVNTNASGTGGVASVLPDVVIPVYVESTPEPTTYTVTLPNGEGYTVVAAEGSTSPVTEGGSYSFTVAVTEDYDGTNMVVKANGTSLTAVEGVYTIENITVDQTVTVEGVVEKQEEPTLTWQEVMAKTKAYLTVQAENKAPVVGSTNGEWLVLGLARNGVEADCFDTYYTNVETYVKNNINASNGRLHASKSTDNSRVILALSALGKDVTNVGGHNLLQGLTDTAYVPYQGVNGAVFALIALDSGAYEIPANADSSKQITREWLINHILSKQLTNGGWALSGQIPDDMTPMAIQALAPYYDTNTDVRAAVDKALAVMQTMTATTETYAQMIVALSALKINCETDERFADVMDKMLTFALENGSFEKGAGSGANQMSTEQAFYAMVAYSRFLEGKTSLYDMTDVVTKEQKYTITIAATENGTVTASAEQAVAGAEITLTVEPAIGYELKALTVKDASNEAVAVTENKFIMPASNVTVTAEFVETENPAQDVIDAIDALSVTKADKATQQKIEEVKAAYDALSAEDQAKVTNYSDLEEAIAIFNQLLNAAKADAEKELEDLFDALKEEDYTKENWEKVQTLRIKALADVEKAENAYEITAIVRQAKADLEKIATGEEITVTFRLIGDGKHDDGVTGHEEYVTWIPTTTYKLKPGATMYDVFMEAVADYGLSQRGAANNYVESIKAPACLGGYWLGEFDNGPNSGWMYTVNGDHPGTGLKTFNLTDGDRIIWHYVDDYVQEERTSSSKYYYRWLEARDISPEAYVKEKVGKILTVGEHGKAEPSEIKLSDIGKDITFTFKPDTGYVIKDVIIDGESKGSITTYTYKNLRYDSRIEVQFAKAGELFDDVKKNDWFYDDVMFAVENGLFNGTGDNQFSPNASMNRAMLVTVLYRLEGEPKVTGSSAFDDVASGQWYTDAVIWATQNEIVNGYGNGKFGPTDSITREQMATILFRYAQFKKYNTSASNSLTGYRDFSNISVFSLKALKWANAEGLINGRTATTLAPQGTVTRAEVAAILHRFVENVVNK